MRSSSLFLYLSCVLCLLAPSAMAGTDEKREAADRCIRDYMAGDQSDEAFRVLRECFDSTGYTGEDPALPELADEGWTALPKQVEWLSAFMGIEGAYFAMGKRDVYTLFYLCNPVGSNPLIVKTHALAGDGVAPVFAGAVAGWYRTDGGKTRRFEFLTFDNHELLVPLGRRFRRMVSRSTKTTMAVALYPDGWLTIDIDFAHLRSLIALEPTCSKAGR